MSKVPLKVCFVGSGDAFSSGGRLQSGIFVESPDGGLLLDCGATLLVGLQRCGLSSDQIRAVAVSHLHGDHFGGLPFLLLEALFVSKRKSKLEIFGPPGLEDRVRQACHALYPGALDGPFPFELRFHEICPDEIASGDFFELSAYQANHGQHAAACSLKVQIAGRVLAYSGDTEWTNQLPALARGADLFVCECCNYAEKIPSHLDYLTLKKHLPDLDCKRLILTHTGPSIDTNKKQIELEIATDGLRLEL